jgi:hypothetical protein
MCRSTLDVSFEVLTPSPTATSYDMAGYSSSGFNSSPEFHPYTAASIVFPDRQAGRQTRCSLLPRFLSPSAFSQPHGATYLRQFPNHRLRCALRVSHPLDALLPVRPPGLVSSRSRSWGSLLEALFRARRRTPSPAPGPSWGSNRFRRTSPPLQGSNTSREARPRQLGFSQTVASVPPRASSPPRLLAPAADGSVNPPCPLTRFVGSAFTLT